VSNPTNPFSWQMPTPTDLVTDLPADFEVFGQAVATSLADLLGGTTDQVLAKNSNTDMDFKWVTSDDANAIQNTIVDAKGDLIAASANDTPARLAVGANGETLIADSSTGTGLKWFSLAKTATDYQAASVNNPAGTAYAASAGTDPTVTITTGTKALIIVQARFFTTNVNFVSFDVSGATTIAAADSGSASVAFGSSSMGTAVTYLDNLTAGSNTFTMKYKCNVTASGSYDLRRITVVVL
jgi:hypothetical protein